MKRFLLPLLLLLVLTAQAEEYLTIEDVAAQTPARWTQAYETPWRTVVIDVPVTVPDVAAWPVLRTGTQPAVSKQLLRACSDSYVSNGVLRNLHIGKDYARQPDDVQHSVTYPGPELPSDMAENSSLTPETALQSVAAELERFFVISMNDLTLVSTEVRGCLYSEDGKAKSAAGEYVFHLRQLIDGIGYQSAVDCYEERLPFSLAQTGSGDAYARISDGHLYLTAFPVRIAATVAEDIPLLPFERVKPVFEAEILAGRLRNIEAVELCFIPFGDPANPDSCFLLPAWVAQGGYTMDAEAEFAPQYDETGYMIDSGKHLHDVVVLAQTGELLHWTDRSSTRRIYASYVSWGDVGH